MIRRKKIIEREIKDMKVHLAEAIKESIDHEKINNETIELIEKDILSLHSEVCLEDTLQGKIELFEKTSFDRISIILKELSATTGKSYLLKPTISYDSFGLIAAEFSKMSTEEG